MKLWVVLVDVLRQLVDALRVENVVIFTEEYGGYFIVSNTTEELLDWMGSQLAPHS